MSLYLYKGMEPPSSIISDSKKIQKLKLNQIEFILNATIKDLIEDKPFVEDQLNEMCKPLNIPVDIFISGWRFFYGITKGRFSVTIEEFKSDLTKLGFIKEQIDLILITLEKEKDYLDNKLRDLRASILPRIQSINWHVDIRTASSEYLPASEVYAIIRFYMGRQEEIRFELDKRQLVWLDKIIEKIKDEFIKWEEMIYKFQI